MRRNFTLIEVLGVVALIAILGTIGFAGYSYAMNAKSESATKALLARLQTGFEMCQSKNAFIPPARDFAEIKVDLDAKKIEIDSVEYPFSYRSSDDEDNSANARKYAFRISFYKTFTQAVEIDNFSRSLNDAGQIIDAWGNPVYFRYPGKFNRGGIDLISAGPDGVFGTSEAETPAGMTAIAEFRDDGEWICDDIANF